MSETDRKQPDLSWVVGAVVESVECGDYDSVFAMTGGISLRVACAWQIVAGGRVTLASGDNGQQYGLPAPIDAAARAMDLLAGRKVRGLRCDPASADLAIELEGAVKLRTFNDSSGYEPWQLYGPDGRSVVGMGGGDICEWGP